MRLKLLLICFGLTPFIAHASFIESTIGTAVVNDATATYHNPAALTLLKNPQLIALGSMATFHTHFIGQSIQPVTGFIQSGSSRTHTDYYLPSIYVGLPVKDKIRFGFAVISNKFNSDIDETSILRYAQASNRIDNVDFIPGVGIQLNDYISIGAGFNYSYANFISNPITGFPSLNIPDSQSHNVTKADSYGGNAGFLIKPSSSTLIGFNYRSAGSYPFSGKSTFQGTPTITSNHYHFNFWTPARSVLTLSHVITPGFGLISTIQRVQWSVFKNVTVHEFATAVGVHPVIIPSAIVPYHFRDTWVFTLGGIKSITPKWVIRVAGSYEQSPGNGNYQITNGNNMIIGTSMAYTIYKNMIIDASYAHAFIKNQHININSKTSLIKGINKGFREGVSIKFTFNM